MNSVTELPTSARIRPPRIPRIPIKAKYVNNTPRNRVAPPTTSAKGNPRFKIKTPRHRIHKNLSPVIPNGPISPREAILKYGSLLNFYERDEIYDFPDIFYLGQPGRKITPDFEAKYNHGYDNESNNYILISGDHLAYRFEILSLFGAGAFGQAVRCYDHMMKRQVAIKVIVNTEQMHEQGKMEAKILSKLNRGEVKNVVRAYDFFIFRNHICITFEILGKNLFEIIEQNGYSPLPVGLVRLYAIQILTGLEQTHRLGIVHCDLKPENILLCNGSNAMCKIIDFGSSCFANNQIYEYIQSRFYRAPEVMIGIKYGPPMDIWSFALIIVELLTGIPLFPGDNEEEQLWMISELLGLPPRELVKIGKRRREFFDDKYDLLTIQSNARVPQSMDLKKVLNTNDPSLIDFIMKCLTWNQKDRLTASELLRHPWISHYEVAITQINSPRPHGLPELKPQQH